MMRVFVLALMASAISLVASDSTQEAPVIQLASEFNVGFELVSKCTSYQYEASERCIGREPFTFYGDSATGCQDYFWCSPEHGACTFTCSTGTVFDQACNCCKASIATASYDLSTCSSSSTSTSISEEQPSAVDTATSEARKHRRILQVLAQDTSSSSSSSSSPSSPALDPQKARVRARARLAQRRRRREAAASRAAAAVGGGHVDSVTSNPSNMADKPAADGPSKWNQYGKKYKGPWEAKDTVKEPAFKSPAPPATDEPAATAKLKATEPATASTAATAAAAAVPEPAAGAVPDLRSSTTPANLRVLLQQDQPLEADASAAAAAADDDDSPVGSTDSSNRRQVQMKRVQPVQRLAAREAAAASRNPADAAIPADTLKRNTDLSIHPHGMIRSSVRPMAKKPAAKQIDPDDEREAPFAAAIATVDPAGTKERPVHVRRMRPGHVAAANAAAPA